MTDWPPSESDPRHPDHREWRGDYEIPDHVYRQIWGDRDRRWFDVGFWDND